MAKKKIAPKDKPTAGKTAKKSAGKSPVKAAASKAGKFAPTEAKAKPAKSAKEVVVTKKKPLPVQKKAIASKAGIGVAQNPVKTSPVKKAPVTPAPKAPLKPAPKAPAKAVAVPKPIAKPAPTTPKGPAKATVVPAKVVVPGMPKTASPPVAERPAPKPLPIKKRPAKERVVMEFYLRSTPTALYELISNPSGFSEWYCDDVDVRGDQYTFIWDQEREVTTLISRKLGEVIRFRRNDDEDPEAFFEFRVRIDDMTNETALVVTDHAWPNEVDKTRNLWASQIHSLQRVLGA